MRISVFPKAKPHPKDREEKRFNSKFTSSPHLPSVVNVINDDDLINIVTNNAWSPSIFNGPRKEDNFVSTDFMVLDIDEGLTIPEAEKRCRALGVCFLILPTTSHTSENHRFRLIFPLVKPITTMPQFRATWKKLQEHFPELDEACSDCCRFYFACTLNDGVFVEGTFMEPAPKRNEKHVVIKEWKTVDKEFYEGKNLLEVLFGQLPDKIPESVDFFLKNAEGGIPGGWRNALNSFVFALASKGIDDEKIVSVIQSVAPEELDARDRETIKAALRDGRKAWTSINLD